MLFYENDTGKVIKLVRGLLAKDSLTNILSTCFIKKTKTNNSCSMMNKSEEIKSHFIEHCNNSFRIFSLSIIVPAYKNC